MKVVEFRVVKEVEAVMDRERDNRREAGEEEAFFQQLQESEEACAEYLLHLKWPNGFVCPYCGYGRAYTIRTRRQPLYECACCRHQTSLTSDTIMEGTRTPLTKWFTAIHHISDPEKGINAVTLSQLIQVTYKTAWSMLHAIRGAISQEKHMLPLTGKVLLHSAELTRRTSPSSSVFIAPPKTASAIVGVALSEEDEPVRVQLQASESGDYRNGQLSRESIETFCGNHMTPEEKVSVIKLNRFAPLKRQKGLPLARQAGEWLRNTFNGIGPKYRQRYLNEFCCRMNLVLAGLSPFREICRMCALPASSF